MAVLIEIPIAAQMRREITELRIAVALERERADRTEDQRDALFLENLERDGRCEELGRAIERLRDELGYLLLRVSAADRRQFFQERTAARCRRRTDSEGGTLAAALVTILARKRGTAS